MIEQEILRRASIDRGCDLCSWRLTWSIRNRGWIYAEKWRITKMCLSKLQIDNDLFNIDLLSLSLSHSDHSLSFSALFFSYTHALVHFRSFFILRFIRSIVFFFFLSSASSRRFVLKSIPIYPKVFQGVQLGIWETRLASRDFIFFIFIFAYLSLNFYFRLIFIDVRSFGRSTNALTCHRLSYRFVSQFPFNRPCYYFLRRLYVACD